MHLQTLNQPTVLTLYLETDTVTRITVIVSNNPEHL